MQISVQESSFEKIYPFWRDHLWPQRKSPIRPVSAISHELKFVRSIEQTNPVFYALHNEENEIIGVISGYKTEPAFFRSRGLYISSHYRGLGLSELLLSAVKTKAIEEGCSFLWTLPRKSAWPAYEKFGFLRSSDWFTENMEFGPNCLAILRLRDASFV